MSDHKGGGAEFCGALYGCSGHEAASRPQPGRGAGGGWPQGALQPWAQQDGWVNARWSGHVWTRTTELLYFVPSLSDRHVREGHPVRNLRQRRWAGGGEGECRHGTGGWEEPAGACRWQLLHGPGHQEGQRGRRRLGGGARCVQATS